MSDDFSPAVIEPVASAARPRWSVMIPTYHSGAFLRATLGSVLAQDPGPHAMQIEVVDDHSTADDPGAIVREVAGDRVQFFRQPDNVGHAANFDDGHWLHLMPMERDESGILDGWLRRIPTGQRLQTPAMVVRAHAREAIRTEASPAIIAGAAAVLVASLTLGGRASNDE